MKPVSGAKCREPARGPVRANQAVLSIEPGHADPWLEVALLLDAGLLATQVAQVVQLGATDVTTGDDLDRLDRRAVEREGPLDTDAVADLADREGLARTTALAADDHA